MTTLIAIFVILIFLQLTAFAVAAFFAWKKVEVFLKWNTRYQSANYEQAVTNVKPSTKPPLPAVKLKTAGRGRAVKEEEQLIDLADMPWEEGYEAVAKIGEAE